MFASISNALYSKKPAEKCMPSFAKHLRMWESEIVWLGFESVFCLTFPNALSIVPSISNFGAPPKKFGSLPKFYWGPLKLLLGASQNFIGSLPKCWSILKLLNVMLWFGSNLKIFFCRFHIEAVWEFGSPRNLGASQRDWMTCSHKRQKMLRKHHQVTSITKTLGKWVKTTCQAIW